MCIVCLEYKKGTLTKLEANIALKELVLTDSTFDLNHIEEVRDLLEETPNESI